MGHSEVCLLSGCRCACCPAAGVLVVRLQVCLLSGYKVCFVTSSVAGRHHALTSVTGSDLPLSSAAGDDHNPSSVAGSDHVLSFVAGVDHVLTLVVIVTTF